MTRTTNAPRDGLAKARRWVDKNRRPLLVALGIAGVATITYVAFRPGKAKAKKLKELKGTTRFGLRTNAVCNSHEIVDPDALRGAFWEVFDRQVDAGVTEPWAISAAVLEKVAPHCRRYPADARNPGEASLNWNMYRDAVCALASEQAIDEQDAESMLKIGQGWAIAQGVDRIVFEDPAASACLPSCTGGMVAVADGAGNYTCECPSGFRAAVGVDGLTYCVEGP